MNCILNNNKIPPDLSIPDICPLCYFTKLFHHYSLPCQYMYIPVYL